MAADDKIMEALARIEHKVDLLLGMMLKVARYPTAEAFPQVGDAGFPCTLCKQPVDYQVDIVNGVVFRKCGCKTGKIALNIGAFAPPTPTTKKEPEDEQRSAAEEDRRNPNRGRGPQRR